MPPVDIVEFFDKAETFSTKFLFFYAPLLGCGLLALKGIEFLFRGLRLLYLTRNGKYVRGRVVGKYREEEDFVETGRWFFLTYPVVQYKREGKTYTCIANRAKKTKLGDVLSVYVCPDGDEHLRVPAMLVMIYGLFLITIAALGASYMYSNFRIFA